MEQNVEPKNEGDQIGALYDDVDHVPQTYRGWEIAKSLCSYSARMNPRDMRPRFRIDVEDDNGLLKVVGKRSTSSVIPRHDSDGAGWPRELQETVLEWTEAFKGFPLRCTMGQPSRLFNVQSGEVVYPEQPVQYAAVSYALSQWTDIEAMLCRLRSVMEPTGVIYAWIDQWCITEADKTAEIRRMECYYKQAAITYVMVPDWNTTFTWELAGFVMLSGQARKAATEIQALEETVWASRVWTVQEAVLSRRIVFLGRNVQKSATELAVARDLNRLSGGPYKHAVWTRNARGESNVRVVSPGSSSGPVTATNILRDTVTLANKTYAKTRYDHIDDVWKLSGARECSREEDRVYGLLGLIRGGEEMSVDYDIGFEEAVRIAADTGLVSAGVLLAETSSERPGRSWCPKPGTESRFRPTTRTDQSGTHQFQSIQLTPQGHCKVQGARFQMPRRPNHHEEFGPRFQMPWKPNHHEELVFEMPRRPNHHEEFVFVPRRPNHHEELEPRFICKNREGGCDFELIFDCGVPGGDEWRGDWLAVVDEGDMPSRTTLVKYEIQDGGVLRKVLALEAGIRKLRTTYLGDFLIG